MTRPVIHLDQAFMRLWARLDGAANEESVGGRSISCRPWKTTHLFKPAVFFFLLSM